MVVCPSCSASAPPGSRYCASCGAALGDGSARHDAGVQTRDEAAREPEQPAAEPVKHGSTLIAGSSVLMQPASRPLRSSSSSGMDHGQFVPGALVNDRYRIVGLLGKGGMGEVYRADDLTLGQSVALKFLPMSLANDENRLERFRNEVRLARQISHTNVCRVYDIGECDGQPFLSMEYIDGEDLASLLRRIGRLPRNKALEIARQLCAGLHAAHELGILHRDLKPMNVMIDGRGKVRITDFGLAALADEATGAEIRAGTPAYMAPEQLTGKAVSVRSDVFSLGLVLYEAFTGEKAFTATTIEELKHQHAESAPRPPSRILDGFDPAIERVLMHCLERDPRDRPVSMLAVAAALPGGDPLAAALAAGETPSPELVAESAHAEGIPPTVCLACLLVILAGIAAFPWLNDQIKLHAIVTLEKPPAVLVDRARDVLARSGPLVRTADEAFGFAVNHAYLEQIETHDDSASRWTTLATGAPPVVEFWYRRSPVPMAPAGDSARVTPADPPLTVPGMALVRLDPAGALLGLILVPSLRDPGGEARAPDWGLLLAAADINPARLTPAEPQFVPPVHADVRQAWTAPYPSSPERRMRIEAAALRGTPVFFHVTPDWGDVGATPTHSDAGVLFGHILGAIVFLASPIGAAVLARRNLALNRGDRRGARRITFFVVGAMMLAWLLSADHVRDVNAEMTLLLRAAGRTLIYAGLCWLLYIALEPHVRRRWPDMLISWSRLLAGRLRDPLLGRDILIGGLFGIFGIVLVAARYFGPGWFGSPPPPPTFVPETTLLGLRYNVAHLLTILTTALFQPMSLLVLLLLLIVLIRTRWLAMLVFYFLLTVTLVRLAGEGGNLYVNLGFYGLLVAALIFVLMRFGLLALMIAVFYVLLLDSYPITARAHAWYWDSSLFALLTLSGLTLYGFIIALAGRPIWLARPTAR